MTDNILIIVYLLMWVATFFWYHHIHKQIDGGSAVIVSYIIYALFSIITLNEGFLNITELGTDLNYKPLRLFPFIYLYLMLMLALLPAIRMHSRSARRIEDPHSKSLIIPCVITIICVCVQVPSLISDFSSGFVDLLVDSDAGNDAYMERFENMEEAGGIIRNLPAVLFNLCYDCSTFLFFYYLTRKKNNRFFLITLFAAIFIGMILPVVNGQRGSVVKAGLTIVAGYMLFRQFYSKRLNHIITIASIGLVTIVSVPIIAITVSRFGDRESGLNTNSYVYYYIGQANIYFNNYALDAGGTRNGDRTFNLLKRLVQPDTPKNYTERRNEYSDLEIDDYVFTTFVGDFVIDFGPTIAVIIFLVFNIWALSHIRPRGRTITLHELLIVYFSLCICMQGGMTLYQYSDTNFLSIVIMAMLYIWLRLRSPYVPRFYVPRGHFRRVRPSYYGQGSKQHKGGEMLRGNRQGSLPAVRQVRNLQHRIGKPVRYRGVRHGLEWRKY